MRHLQIIKEHIYIRRFIAYINVQITALVYRHIVKQMGGKRITGGGISIYGFGSNQNHFLHLHI